MSVRPIDQNPVQQRFAAIWAHFCTLRKKCQTSAVQRRKSRKSRGLNSVPDLCGPAEEVGKPTTSASFGQRLPSNQVKKRGHVKDTITITMGVSGR